MRELPRSLVIVGGGYIALELGQMFRRFGAQVTILERGPRLLQGFEPEAGLAITEILRDEGVRVETGTPVRRVQRDGEGVLVSGDREGRRYGLRRSGC